MCHTCLVFLLCVLLFRFFYVFKNQRGTTLPSKQISNILLVNTVLIFFTRSWTILLILTGRNMRRDCVWILDLYEKKICKDFVSEHIKIIVYINELKTQILSCKNYFKWMSTRSIVGKRYNSVTLFYFIENIVCEHWKLSISYVTIENWI